MSRQTPPGLLLDRGRGTLTLTTDPAGEYQLDQFLERSGVEKFTKKKDEKLEKLKVCAEALLDPDKAR